MHGPGEVPSLKLVLFTHVNDEETCLVREHRSKAFAVAFLNPASAGFDTSQKPRRVSFRMGQTIRVHGGSTQHQAHDRFVGWPTMQRQGAAAAEEALASDQAKAILVLKEHDEDIARLCKQARDAGVPVHEITDRDMWRMAQPGDKALPSVLTLVGRDPQAAHVGELMARGGMLLCLDGVAYAGNMGFSVRTAEVSGAAGVVLASDQPILGRAWKDLRHSSMQATRFIPVVECRIEEAIASAKSVGYRVVVIEDVGSTDLPDVDLTGDVMLVVGAEAEGVSTTALDAADAVVRLPMHGFVPSYNLQVAVACACVEAARQRR